MSEPYSLKSVRWTMLLRSIYVLAMPLFLLFSALACTGTPLTGSPVYTCPTNNPLPTTMTLPGTPTATPPPTGTPYALTSPTDFFVGDAVFIGTSASESGVRFRLQNVEMWPASPDADGDPRTVYSWQLEVKNIGTADYEIFPSAQMYLSEISTAYGDVSGVWSPIREAAEEIGTLFDDAVYVLAPGLAQVFHLAAYGPAGVAKTWTFQLDPTVSEGSPVITWINQTNPYCSGDISDPS